MTRTVKLETSPYVLAARLAAADMRQYAEGLTAAEWLNTPANIALSDSRNMMLFTAEEAGIYRGHWLLVDRGREAFRAGAELLRHLFSAYPAQIVYGDVPAAHRASRWFTRQMGFKSSGIRSTDHGAAERFSITRQDFEARYGLSEIEELSDQSAKRLDQLDL